MSIPIGSVPGLEQQSVSRGSPAGSSPARAHPAAAAGGRERFQKALGALGHEIDHGEAVVRRALDAGGHMGAGQLIALQAGIYRYSEAVDLTAKLVDRASTAVQTTLRGQ